MSILPLLDFQEKKKSYVCTITISKKYLLLLYYYQPSWKKNVVELRIVIRLIRQV